jgi:putative CocE/NonD family hydrolase
MKRPRRLRWLLSLGSLAIAGLVVLATPATRHVLIGQLPPIWKIRAESTLRGIRVDHSVRIEMPDGVHLAASLYLPRGEARDLPTVLVRLPYGRNFYGDGYNAGLFFARYGYAVLVQDLRGTGDSQGELLPWRDVAGDGVATLDWIARQPWSNGKVGTFGCSALGETQLVLAPRNHPAHRAIITSGSGGAVGKLQGRYGYFGVFEGGVFQLASGFGWFEQYGAKDPHAARGLPFDTRAQLRKLPLATLMESVRPAPNGYADFLAAPLGDPHWEQWGYLTDDDVIEVPTMLINTWGDQTVGDALVLAEYQRRHSRTAAEQQKVIIAPGVHCQQEKFELPAQFGAPNGVEGEQYRRAYLLWFDHWLRGVGPGLDGIAPYTYYMLGEDRWYEADRWPPADSQMQRWYLDSGGHANTRDGDGALRRQVPAVEASDTYRYDPGDPVPTRGGPVCCTGDPRDVSGSVDQADVERRPDVLVYTSAPLAQDLRIAGPLTCVLTFSSDVRDTDLVARLVDVAPDHVARNIQEGALRLRYRDGAPAALMEPGQSYSVRVDMRAIAYRVPSGHRLRLDVTSSSFPRLERNLNGAGDNYRETQSRVATNRLHHGPGIDAWLELSVLSGRP